MFVSVLVMAMSTAWADDAPAETAAAAAPVELSIQRYFDLPPATRNKVRPYIRDREAPLRERFYVVSDASGVLDGDDFFARVHDDDRAARFHASHLAFRSWTTFVLACSGASAGIYLLSPKDEYGLVAPGALYAQAIFAGAGLVGVVPMLVSASRAPKLMYTLEEAKAKVDSN